MNVLLTFDVECWPEEGRPLPATIEAEVASHVYGSTESGESFGIDWQMETMGRHGLRGVFFVEALCGTRGFRNSLRQIVASIQSKGHDVEAHAHTEWFGYAPKRSVVGGECRRSLGEYSLDEQAVIIGTAVDELQRCGAVNIVAFRAGNFGANGDTVAAVRRAGLSIDSSYSAVYAGGDCRIETPAPTTQPFRMGDVWEYPVGCFRDQPRLRPKHLRPLQVTATSFAEMSSVLLDACRRRLDTMVILSHSFEMTHFSPRAVPPRKHSLNVRRFEQLCRFLGERKDLFNVTTFKEAATRREWAGPSIVQDLPESNTLRFLVRGFQNLSARLLRF